MARYIHGTVLPGDTLQRIALREMGAADRWPELIYLNNLRAPYIVATAAEAEVQPGTLWPGQRIRIPRNTDTATAVTPPEDLYGADVRLVHGELRTEDGDLLITEGIPNLNQAIRHRLHTEPEELLRHPRYGCKIWWVLGLPNTGAQRQFAELFVRQALRDEPRISVVQSVESQTVSGDELRITARVAPVQSNTPFDANLVFPIGEGDA